MKAVHVVIFTLLLYVLAVTFVDCGHGGHHGHGHHGGVHGHSHYHDHGHALGRPHERTCFLKKNGATDLFGHHQPKRGGGYVENSHRAAAHGEKKGHGSGKIHVTDKIELSVPK